jgi:hypothetical protein
VYGHGAATPAEYFCRMSGPLRQVCLCRVSPLRGHGCWLLALLHARSTGAVWFWPRNEAGTMRTPRLACTFLHAWEQAHTRAAGAPCSGHTGRMLHVLRQERTTPHCYCTRARPGAAGAPCSGHTGRMLHALRASADTQCVSRNYK